MDLNFKMPDYTFNCRCAALIKYQDKYLVERKLDTNTLGLIGGRVSLGETSINALKREIKEEMGEDVTYKRSVGIIENFFVSRYKNAKYHEILFILEVEFPNKAIYNQDNFINQEEPDTARFIWLPKEKLRELEPKILYANLDKTEFFHLINNELEEIE